VKITEATKLTTRGLTRRAFLLLLGAISLCCLTAHAQEPPLHKIPFTLRNNQIFIHAKVNGQPALLKFDTGATACVFYKFEPPESIGSASIDVRTASGVAKGEQGFARLEIGNFAITLRVAYMHTSSPAEDGLLALDVLRHFKRVTIDFAKSEIDLEDQGHASD
jgi:hypothetical protein